MDDEKDKDKLIDSGFISLDIDNLPVFYGDGFTERDRNDIMFNWSANDAQNVPSVDEPGKYRWLTAIQKVDPKSGAFWFDYGRRYNEKVVMKLNPEKDAKGRRSCDVLVHTKRTMGDLVTSAWGEYNRWMVKR